jgi:hypothetical protein
MTESEFYLIHVDPETAVKRDFTPTTYNRKAENAQTRLRNEQFPDFEPQFSDLLVNTENLTDFIYDGGAISGSGFLVSGRVKRIFEAAGAENIKFYPLVLRRSLEGVKQADHPRITGDISYMQLVWPPIGEWIDFEKSAFERINRDDNSRTPLAINDETELLNFISCMTWPAGIGATTLTMNVPSLSAVSVLNLMPIQFRGFNQAIISAAIKEQLEKENISGYALLPITEINCIVVKTSKYKR